MGAIKARNLFLYQLRTGKLWSQKETSTRLGVPLITYQRIEQGKSRGSPEFWLKVQELYELSDDEAFKAMKQSQEGG